MRTTLLVALLIALAVLAELYDEAQHEAPPILSYSFGIWK